MCMVTVRVDVPSFFIVNSVDLRVSFLSAISCMVGEMVRERGGRSLAWVGVVRARAMMMEVVMVMARVFVGLWIGRGWGVGVVLCMFFYYSLLLGRFCEFAQDDKD